MLQDVSDSSPEQAKVYVYVDVDVDHLNLTPFSRVCQIGLLSCGLGRTK